MFFVSHMLLVHSGSIMACSKRFCEWLFYHDRGGETQTKVRKAEFTCFNVLGRQTCGCVVAEGRMMPGNSHLEGKGRVKRETVIWKGREEGDKQCVTEAYCPCFDNNNDIWNLF